MVTLDDGSLSFSTPDAYAGVSVRSLPGYIYGPACEALPCYRIGEKMVVKR